MKFPTPFTALGLLAAVLFTAPARAAEENFPAVGKPAPEINAKTWLNRLGAEPLLANVRGQPMLIEFWATWCGPCKVAMPHIQKLHEEYAEAGLLVVALSSEEDGVVQQFIEQNNYSFVVGSGSTTGSAYGVEGIPHTFLVDATGNLFWHGYPSEVNDGLLKGLMKGVKKPAGGMLGVRTDFGVDARVTKAQKLAGDGKLADAIKEIDAIGADAKSSEQQKSDAKAVRDAIDRHLGNLTNAAENLVKAKDVARALTVFDALAKDAAVTDFGAKAKKRGDEIRADSKLMAEVEAGQAFDKLRDMVKPLSTEKAKGKYDEFAKKYAGTKAGERAKAMARGK